MSSDGSAILSPRDPVSSATELDRLRDEDKDGGWGRGPWGVRGRS